MSLKFIDISNWQKGLNVATVVKNGGLGAVVVKATEGLNFTDKSCDGFVQQCIANGIPFGFYHFARNNGATAEADFFRNHTKGYEGKGIPILDWEDNQSVAWVNEFVRRYHSLTGVWPWVYANPWRFRQGTVEPNCGRWVAGYPKNGITDINYGLNNGLPSSYNVGSVCAWQFSSSVRISGYNGNLDGDVFYGDAAAWNAYAGKNESEEDMTTDQANKLNAIYDFVSGYAGQQLTRTDTADHDNPSGHNLYGRIQIIEFNLSLVMKALGIEDWYRSHAGGSGMDHPSFDEEAANIGK